MIENPKVTVLMAVYNGQQYLREAIESILDQTFGDFEFVTIDDGSADSSKEIVLSYDDPRIRFYENETNILQTKTLNKGIRLARGEYIARMDADDISLPQRLEKQVAYLDAHPEYAMAGGRSQTIDGEGNVCKTQTECYSKERIYYQLHFGNVFPHASVMLRKSNLDSVGGYDESFPRAQDYELWNRLSKQYPIGMVDDILLKWRDNGGSVSYRHKDSQQSLADTVFRRDMQTLFPKAQEPDLQDMQCFHDINVKGWSNVKIGFDKLLLLRKINERIMKDAPEYIDRSELEKVCRERMSIYMKKRLGEVSGMRSLYHVIRKSLK